MLLTPLGGPSRIKLLMLVPALVSPLGAGSPLEFTLKVLFLTLSSPF